MEPLVPVYPMLRQQSEAGLTFTFLVSLTRNPLLECQLQYLLLFFFFFIYILSKLGARRPLGGDIGFTFKEA